MRDARPQLATKSTAAHCSAKIPLLLQRRQLLGSMPSPFHPRPSSSAAQPQNEADSVSPSLTLRQGCRMWCPGARMARRLATLQDGVGAPSPSSSIWPASGAVMQWRQQKMPCCAFSLPPSSTPLLLGMMAAKAVTQCRLDDRSATSLASESVGTVFFCRSQHGDDEVVGHGDGASPGRAATSQGAAETATRQGHHQANKTVMAGEASSGQRRRFALGCAHCSSRRLQVRALAASLLPSP